MKSEEDFTRFVFYHLWYLDRESLIFGEQNWYRSKKKAFTKYAKLRSESTGKSSEREVERIKKYCTVVRLLAHTQSSKIGLKQKKAHLMEIQVNGGSIAEKLEFCKGHFEKTIHISEVFEQDENIDVIGGWFGEFDQFVLLLIKFCSCPQESPRVKDSKVLPTDGELKNYREKLIKVYVK